MKLSKTAAMLALTAAAATAQFGASTVFAGPPDDREIYEMLQRSSMINKDGMVTKADFMKMMEKRFDSADKKRRGMLTPEEIARILDPNVANP